MPSNVPSPSPILSKAATGGVLYKRVFLEISKKLIRKTPVPESLF